MHRLSTKSVIDQISTRERREHPAWRLAAAATLAALMPAAAFAYVGPGAGLTAIGTVLALFAALALAIVGFVWYPLKRLLGHRQPVSSRAGTGAKANNGRGGATPTMPPVEVREPGGERR